LAVFTSFNILANNFLPLNVALYGKAMIEYIRTIRQERKSLSKNLRTVTDILGVLSIICGGFLFIKLFSLVVNSPSGDFVLNLKEFSDILFWLVYICCIVIFYSIGQFIVLGFTTSILCILGRLTIKESLRYTFYYRLPVSWLGK
jgi:hypothetical protein